MWAVSPRLSRYFSRRNQMTKVNLSSIREKLWGNLDGYAKDFAKECEDNFDSYTCGRTYIDDTISQFADGQVDVYHSALRQWAMNNIDALEDVIEEGCYEPLRSYNFYDHIQAAQFWSIEREINDSLSDIIEYLAVSYLWRIAERDYTGAEIDDLEDYLDPCSMSTFDEVEEAVDNFMAEED